MNNLNSIVDYLKVFNNINKRKAYEPRTMAQEPRNMYAGGQLVQNTDDGSRPGYAEDARKEKKKQWYKDRFNKKLEAYDEFQKSTDYTGTDKEFEKWKKKQKGYKKVQPLVRAQHEKITKYLEKLIPELNAGEKYINKEGVSAMVEKKFNIKPRYVTTTYKGVKTRNKVNRFSIKDYPVMKNLDSVETKIDNTLKNMLLEKKPLNNFWYQAVRERIGLSERALYDNLDNSPTYKVIKDQGALALKDRFNREGPHTFLKEKSFSDQLTEAFKMEEGMPRLTGVKNVYTSSPKFKVMQFATREFHRNQGNGAIQFFKNGKPIKWGYGVELPYNQVSFTYNGKNYNANKLSNTDLLKKDFPEVYEKQTAINKLSVEEIDDPLKKGKKISMRDLIKRNQVNAYKWEPRRGTLDILHGQKGVKGEPFTNLNFNTRDINQLEMGIDQSKTLSQTQKNSLIKSINKLAGSGDPEAIIQRQIGLTKDIKSGKIKGYEDMKNKFLKQAGFNIDKCLSSGGRVNLKFGKGVNSCITGVIEAEQKAAQRGSKEALKKFSKFGKAARFAGWFLGPIDLAVELGFALPHMLQGDKEAAKRATTYGLLGWGEKKLDEIKADSPEAYKYAKHVKDNNDWVDAWFSQQDAEQNLEVLKNVPEGSQTEKRAFYTNQKNTAINTMAQIQEGYVGYVDEEGRFDRMGGTKGKISLQDYLRENVKKKADAGFQIDIDLPFYQKKNVAGIAPFKGGQPITNVKQYIEQKNEPYWKSGLEHAAYEAGVPDLFDTFMQGADNKDPRDLYSELPLKYASQLGKMEAEETRRLLARKKAKEEADEAAERYGPYTRFAEGGIMNLKKNKW